MRQTISIDQLNELSQPARQKLREYMLKEWARPMKDQFGNWIHAEIPTDDYQLSIGQMIEFLEEHVIIPHNRKVDIEDKGSYWEYRIVRLLDGCWILEGDITTSEGSELADCLWEACKTVLEKDGV